MVQWLDAVGDDTLLLDLLNTAPTVDGQPTDQLAGVTAARSWVAAHGGPRGTDVVALRAVRDRLAGVVRGHDAAGLGAVLAGVDAEPVVVNGGVRWRLRLPKGRELATRAVLAWSDLERSAPGRLRPCGNDECTLFLVDRTKAGNARWCSMATCGNRMKARRHHRRERDGDVGSDPG